MMRIIIAIFRLICLLFVTIFWFTISLILGLFISKQSLLQVARLWAKTTLLSVGAKVNIIGNKDNNYYQSNCIVVANHVSWLDIPVVYATYAVSFIARAEIKNWLILGRLMRYVGTLFIDRNKKRDILNVNKSISDQLTNGGTIGLFPEGKTSDGNQVLPFRSPLLENAITTPHCQIIPLVIEYSDQSGRCAAKHITYTGDISLYQTIKNTLLIDRLHINIYILPKVNANSFTKRNELSAFLYAQISSRYMADNINSQPENQIQWNEDEVGAMAKVNSTILNPDDTATADLKPAPIKVTDNI
jgi:1-acyl-sn-glycerol-3-phosphate acyltransferase